MIIYVIYTCISIIISYEKHFFYFLNSIMLYFGPPGLRSLIPWKLCLCISKSTYHNEAAQHTFQYFYYWFSRRNASCLLGPLITSPKKKINFICTNWIPEFESLSGRGVQHYVIKFVSDLRHVGGFFRVLRFPPTIKLTATI